MKHMPIHLQDRNMRPICASPFSVLHHYVTTRRFDDVRCIRCHIMATENTPS